MSSNALAILKQPERHDWTTPPRLFNVLDEEFGFTLDAAASDENAKCDRYFTADDDGLAQSWTTPGYVFCNPPYGNHLATWVRKAYAQARLGQGVVLLIPARTDTSWWHTYVMKAHEIRFIRGRVRFSGSAINAPFPSCVVVYRGGVSESPVFSAMDRYLEVAS